MLIAALVLAFVFVTIRRADAWPITRYPMFSRPRDPDDVCVICFALETPDGLRWWRPHFYRYPDYLARKLAAGGLAERGLAERLWCVSEILRLARLEQGSERECVAVHIIERRWINCAVRDRTVARVPVNGADSASAV
jgi:hypothetical protein